jgi:serine/threonine protein kinase
MSMIGKILGNFEITGQLGKGGMGEVYQAKDRKLGRDVAIKVLPEEFARDTDRVARFQREAKLLASLNHPNIAAIYGLEASEGTNFLVLELVEGQTLADRIKAGPIPVEEALKSALQITEALEAAHEKGVVHRDLKLSNIKVTPEGKVKVLDFGLAKAFAGDQEVNLSNSPTLSDAATQQGVILGTAAYMSPEQAKGKTVDKRADIWAFGVVLFEMLTGRQLFTGETVSETLAAVLKSEPEWNRLPPNLHPRIRLLLERCLEKDVKNRYSSIGDARVDIQKVLSDPGGVLVQPVAAVKPRARLRLGLPLVTSAVVIATIIVGVAVWKLKPPESRRVMRFDYELSEGQQFRDLSNPSLAVSPDGSKFVYNTNSGLYLRSMDQPNARFILGPDKSPKQPFFSPDGQWVGYWSEAEKQLKKISISGGAPVTLANTSANPVLPSWGADDTIVYGQFGTGKILRVSGSGGTPELLCETQGSIIFAPQILPDGKSVLFSQLVGTEYRVIVQSLKSGQRKPLMPMQGTVSRYLPTGHIVYMVGNALFAIPFNPDRLESTGGPVSMVEGILWLGTTAAPQYAISDSGTLVYVPGGVTTGSAAPGRTLVWVNRKGVEEPLKAPPNVYRHPKISPDGTQVALTIATEGNTDIWIWGLARETMTRLTFDDGLDLQSIWTIDGKRIVYYSNPAGKSQAGVYWKAADGTGKTELLASAQDRMLMPWSFSKDGKTLAMTEIASGMNLDIGLLSMEGNHARKLLLQEKYGEMQPKISPDGRWMAYASYESGHSEIYVRPFPEVDKGRWQVSTNGGDSPLWSPDGREIFYRKDDAAIAVSVETEPTFKPGKAEILFRGPYVLLGGNEGHPWDISPDGKRFLMMKEPQSTPSAGGGPRKISIVVNWFEELKQRAPVK